MKKRVLSLLLVMLMVFSMLPATALAVDGQHIAVSADAPTSDTKTVGQVYTLDLNTVFTDSQNHKLTYKLDSDYGTQTYVTEEGTLVFNSSEAKTYNPVITATCAEGDTASYTIKLVFTAADEGDPKAYDYDETNAESVRVTVTFSNDGYPIAGKDGTVLSHLELQVPYFDLAGYGLSEFYRYGTENGKGGYVNETLIKRPTLLHLYIYMLERYYMGLPESECGKGTSGVMDYAAAEDVKYADGTDAFSSNGKKALSVTGSATSLFMESLWGHDLNLMYYRNHMYPLMDAGWGSTADYILLSDGDDIDLGMYTNYDFYSYGAFVSLDHESYTAKAGESLRVSTMGTATSAANDGSSHLEILKTPLDIDVFDAQWNALSVDYVANGDGTYDIPVPNAAGDYYIMAYDKNVKTTDACFSPGTAKLTVEKAKVDISKYYENYPYDSITYGENKGYLVDITEGSVTGFSGESIPTYQVIVPAGTKTVDVTYPSGSAFVEYTGSYTVSTGQVGYGNDAVTVTENTDGTVTVTIPIENCTGTNTGILIENDSYQMTAGFDFVVGSITDPFDDSGVVKVKSVTLSAETATVERRDTYTLTAAISPSDALNRSIVWSSSDKSVATVKDGVVTAVTVGTADITVTTRDGGHTDTCTITVIDPNKPQINETDGYYEITTAKELKWFAAEVNDGNSEMNARLMNDIDLSSACSAELGTWIPIGSTAYSVQFSGVFDGQGHKITNYYFNERADFWERAKPAQGYRGLFGKCVGAEIKNLSLYGEATNNARWLAGIAGWLESSTMENCHNYAAVTLDITDNATRHVDTETCAGVAAYVCKSSLTNCSNHGDVTGAHGWVGGVVAYAQDCVLEGCYNTGDVIAQDVFDNTLIGGVASGLTDCVTRNCYNTGSICYRDVYFATKENAKAIVGGVVGSVSNEYKSSSMSNCYNAGTLLCNTGFFQMGGVAGNFDITPKVGEATVTNCYYLNTTAVSDQAGGIAVTAEKLKSNSMVVALGESYHVDTDNINGGLPILAWQGGTEAAPDSGASMEIGVTGVTVAGVNATEVPGKAYTVTVPYGTTVTADSFTITLVDSKASVTAGPSENDNVWSFTVTAEDGATTANYKVTVSIGEEPVKENKADVAAAKTTVSGASYNVIQRAANTEAAVKSAIEATLGTLSLNHVATSVKITGFTAAVAGTVSHEDGTDGSFTATVTLSKGSASETVIISGTITAEPYVASHNPSIPSVPTTPSKPTTDSDPDSSKTFDDVTKDIWYHDAVAYVTEKGLMNGTSAVSFSPLSNATRGMIVTILARLEGVDTTKGAIWYEAGRSWAMENDISDGTSMTGEITREQLAALLFRYAKLKGYDVSQRDSLDSFTDKGTVSEFASDAMQWAVAIGLINGRASNSLAPQGNATRAEIAAILMRFCESTAK